MSDYLEDDLSFICNECKNGNCNSCSCGSVCNCRHETYLRLQEKKKANFK